MNSNGAPTTHEEFVQLMATQNQGPERRAKCKFCGSTDLEWVTYEDSIPEKHWMLVEVSERGEISRHKCQELIAFVKEANKDSEWEVIKKKTKTWKPLHKEQE